MTKQEKEKRVNALALKLKPSNQDVPVNENRKEQIKFLITKYLKGLTDPQLIKHYKKCLKRDSCKIKM